MSVFSSTPLGAAFGEGPIADGGHTIIAVTKPNSIRIEQWLSRVKLRNGLFNVVNEKIVLTIITYLLIRLIDYSLRRLIDS